MHMQMRDKLKEVGKIVFQRTDPVSASWNKLFLMDEQS